MAYEMPYINGDLQDMKFYFHALSSLDGFNKSKLQLWEMDYKESILWERRLKKFQETF